MPCASLLLLWGCSSRPAAQDTGAILFREVAAETQLKFQHFTGSTGQYYMPEIMGAGVALFDYDGDGDLDVFLVQDTMLDPSKKPSEAKFPLPPGAIPGNRLFRNDLIPSGKLHFTDVTGQAGLGRVAYGMGVAVADYNNDGYQDLYVTGFGSNILYRNNGNGTFTDVTREAGVGDTRWSASASFLDYDKDGNLDLYVTHYLDFTVRGNKDCYDSAGQRDYCRPAVYRYVPDRLFRNLGNGKFQDVTQAANIGTAVAPGLGVVSADFNGDGWPDIYVANDGAPNILWINQRNGTFKESALLSGAAYSADGLARAGMGVTAGDFDDSGNESIFVTNLVREGGTLFRNSGRGEFSDATMGLGLQQLTFPFTGFGAQWFDYDNDGRLDLFIANGAVNILENLRGTPYPFHQRNQLIHNEGDKFREASAAAGPAFQLSDVGRGAAFGDIDNDGDIDIVVNNNNGPARLLLNESGSRRHWLEVLLQAAQGNRDAIGARVVLLREGQKPLYRRVHTDGSYLSASDRRVHFGLGDKTAVQDLLVEWPDGSKEKWDHVQAEQLVRLRQGTGSPTSLK